jgi:hypothetical protein
MHAQIYIQCIKGGRDEIFMYPPSDLSQEKCDMV